MPIKDEADQVIGCLALAMSLKNQGMLEQATQSLSATSEQIVASTEELAASAQELAKGMELIDTLRKEMEEQVQRTEKLLTFIKEVARNLHILGINASNLPNKNLFRVTNETSLFIIKTFSLSWRYPKDR
ncbi:MAG: hypothetical protein HPY74_16515 [Firmicutes bacterium]|nr:hypothetical protein [Bacillota bacterium]